jgi:hypothetical protein
MRQGDDCRRGRQVVAALSRAGRAGRAGQRGRPRLPPRRLPAARRHHPAGPYWRHGLPVVGAGASGWVRPGRASSRAPPSRSPRPASSGPGGCWWRPCSGRGGWTAGPAWPWSRSPSGDRRRRSRPWPRWPGRAGPGSGPGCCWPRPRCWPASPSCPACCCGRPRRAGWRGARWPASRWRAAAWPCGAAMAGRPRPRPAPGSSSAAGSCPAWTPSGGWPGAPAPPTPGCATWATGGSRCAGWCWGRTARSGWSPHATACAPFPTWSTGVPGAAACPGR